MPIPIISAYKTIENMYAKQTRRGPKKKTKKEHENKSEVSRRKEGEMYFL